MGLGLTEPVQVSLIVALVGPLVLKLAESFISRRERILVDKVIQAKDAELQLLKRLLRVNGIPIPGERP